MIQHKRIKKKGNGIFDFLKPVISLVSKAIEHKDLIGSVASTARDAVNIGKNTRDIIKQIRSKKTPSEVGDIVERINRLRVGTGFAYI